jgi:hypothetical protein
MQFPAFLTDNRPYLIADGAVALQWPSAIEERRAPLRDVRLLTRQDRAISTETSFNVSARLLDMRLSAFGSAGLQASTLHVPVAEPKSFLKQSLMAELKPASDVAHKLSG